jgi:hypothetical protein
MRTGRRHAVRGPVEETNMSLNRPVSWRSIVYGTPVMSSANERVGEVREVLGSDAEDLFHGLRVRLADQRRDVMMPADDIDSIGVDAIATSLTRAEIEALGAYDETATYHLGSVGRLRTHLGWKQDSKSDEEPG